MLEISGVLHELDPAGWIGDKGYIGNGMLTPTSPARLGHGDPDPHRHQHRPQADQGRGRPRRDRGHPVTTGRMGRQASQAATAP